MKLGVLLGRMTQENDLTFKMETVFNDKRLDGEDFCQMLRRLYDMVGSANGMGRYLEINQGTAKSWLKKCEIYTVDFSGLPNLGEIK